MSAFRRLGYRLFGSRFDYLLHTRPAEWPVMAAHTVVGYLLAVGLEGARHGEARTAAALGLVAWVVCLNGGTLALNSAFDHDDGDIAYLREPPKPPPHLAAFGFGLMALGFAVAAPLPAWYLAAYALCSVLSILYSVPPVRLKAVPGADWLINMWGFGAITPLALWAATGKPLDPARGLVLLAFCPLFAALYPLTQLYQLEEDRRRGDRTLASLLGARRSLVVAAGSAALAFAGFVGGGVRAGWGTAMGEAWRWATLAVAAAAWAMVLGPWLLRAERMTPREHQRGMYLALASWAVTDVVVVVAWAV